MKRDPSVVDNRVVCPSCNNIFCWICLGDAKDDHFDDDNLKQCPGKQYKDVRNERKLWNVAYKRLCLMIRMPWINIYYNISALIKKVNGCNCYQKCNCFLRLMIKTIVSITLMPFILIIGFIGGIFSGLISFFC